MGKPTRGGHRSAPAAAGDKQRSYRRLEASEDRQSSAGLSGRRTASTRGASSPVSWGVSSAGLLVRTASDVLGATGGRRWGGGRRLRTLATEFETWEGRASRTRRAQRHRRRGRTETGRRGAGPGGRRERESTKDGERNGRVTAAQCLSRAPDAGESGQAKARRGDAGLVAGGVGGYQGKGEAWIRSAACVLHNMRRRKEKGKPRTEGEGAGWRLNVNGDGKASVIWNSKYESYLPVQVGSTRRGSSGREGAEASPTRAAHYSILNNPHARRGTGTRDGQSMSCRRRLAVDGASQRRRRALAYSAGGPGSRV